MSETTLWRLRERKWLLEKDPQGLLKSAHAYVSDRKLRLLAVACCWPRYRLALRKGTKHIVQIVADYADGTASWEDVCSAADDIRGNLMLDHLAYPIAADSARMVLDDYLEQYPNSKNQIVRLIREIVRNPFCLTSVDPSCLSWNDGTVPKMAEGIYEKRDFKTLPILADALEDAGCTDSEILDHCRGRGPHVRGCWVVDLLLSKE
jgi:hypothetical protein